MEQKGRKTPFFPCFFYIILCSLLFAACPEIFPPNVDDIPYGMGAFYLALDDIDLRSIKPKSNLNQFSSYTLNFYRSGTSDEFLFSEPRTTDDFSNPVFLVPGDYIIEVLAYIDEDWELLAAKGSAAFSIDAGVSATVSVPLVATMTSGTGFFTWKIIFLDGLINDLIEATMTITPLSGGTSVPIQDFLDAALPDNTIDPLELASGYYRVIITLKKPGESNVDIIRREILHVYPNLVSEFVFEFTDAHFNEYPVIVDRGGINENFLSLTAALAWINNEGPGDYSVILNDSQAIEPFIIPAGKRISLFGNGAAHEISLLQNGALFTVGWNTSLTLGDNIVLAGHSGNTSALVVVSNDTAAFTMNGTSKIINNKTEIDSAGVRVNSGTFTMNGGTISGNEAKKGAGVFMSGGTFNMEGGFITGNEVVFVGSDTDSLGAGVVVSGIVEPGQDPTTFNMTGGEISDNESIGDGGGIHISGGIVNIYDNALITDNSAQRAGGGINISGGTVNVFGGAITKNEASNGGGIFLSYGNQVVSELNITGGRIGGEDPQDRNAARNNGGGVAFHASAEGTGIFKIGGNAVIKNNINVTSAVSNVFLDQGRYITLNAPGSIDISVTKITNGGVIVEDITGTGITAGNITQYIKSDFNDREPMLYDNKIALTIFINSPAQLQRVGDGINGWLLGAHYLQTAPDINLSGIPNWTPIGPAGAPFTGVYDGGGNTISNMTIISGIDQGLFGYIVGGTIKNLGLEKINITASHYIGGIASDIGERSIIENCYVTGSITANSSASNNAAFVGGIAGLFGDSIIRNCWTNVEIIASNGDSIGGIVGLLFTSDDDPVATGTITNSFALGNVIGRENVGGITGFNLYGIVSSCYAAGNIHGIDDAGGVVGYNAGDVVNNIALNSIVTISEYLNVGRIIGGYAFGDISNNFGFSDMVLKIGASPNGTGGSTVSNLYNDHDDIDGEDISASDARNKSTWVRAGFRFVDSSPAGPWIWDASGTNMPLLRAGSENPWPEHIRGGGINIILQPFGSSGLLFDGLTDKTVNITTATSVEINITNASEYSSIRWLWNGVPLSTTDTLVLSGSGAPFNGNSGESFINVIVVKDGNTYSDNFKVIVE